MTFVAIGFTRRTSLDPEFTFGLGKKVIDGSDIFGAIRIVGSRKYCAVCVFLKGPIDEFEIMDLFPPRPLKIEGQIQIRKLDYGFDIRVDFLVTISEAFGHGEWSIKRLIAGPHQDPIDG